MRIDDLQEDTDAEAGSWYEPEGLKLYLFGESADMRKQTNGLIALVAGTHYMDPFEKALFFFTNKKRDKVCLKVHKTIAITAFRVENQPHLWYHKCVKNRQITKDLSSLSRNDSELSVK